MANPYALALFRNRLEGIAEEMGRALARSAFSPNIRDRLDYSCALFSAEGLLLAQAAHIPVHLGSLPDLVAEIVTQPQRPGDCWIANSPYHGGTHLPDLTLVMPVFDGKYLIGYTATRAHHADVGGMTPGSMPNSQEVFQEGLILPPCRLQKSGRKNTEIWSILLSNVRTPAEREGDLRAQLAGCELGARRLRELHGAEWNGLCTDLLEHAELQIQQLLVPLGDCEVETEEALDWGEHRFPIQLRLKVQDGVATLDFRDSGPAQPAPINATRAITCAAAYFPFFCLAHQQHGRVVVNAGSLRRLRVLTRPGSLLHACSPFPVCAGNVETSQRICDAVWKALARLIPQRVPAQSASTMNNLTIGNSQAPFTYYETCGGGHGGGPMGPGASGQQVAMTNTRNTPAEVLETYYPLRLWQYALRPDSGGAGYHAGGCGVVRELELLTEAQVSLLATRRSLPAQGCGDAEAGATGADRVQQPGRPTENLLPPWSGSLGKGSRIIVQTPGGGGWSPGKSSSIA